MEGCNCCDHFDSERVASCPATPCSLERFVRNARLDFECDGSGGGETGGLGKIRWERTISKKTIPQLGIHPATKKKIGPVSAPSAGLWAAEAVMYIALQREGIAAAISITRKLRRMRRDAQNAISVEMAKPKAMHFGSP
jgi:hypothetical protein